MPYVKTTWFGIFQYNETITDKRLFPTDADTIAERLSAIMHGEILKEERELMNIKTITDDPRLRSISTTGTVKHTMINPSDYGYNMSLLQDACIRLTLLQIDALQQERTVRIAEAVDAFEDLIKITNLLLERIRSWYSYFSLDPVDTEEHLIKHIDLLSIGTGSLDCAEEQNLRYLGIMLKMAMEIRENLEKYITQVVEEMAPNVSKIVGSGIAARLIAQAGSIEKLAMLSAGTIQVLGAEKALFRHIKEGTPPPKHGILFQHEMINTAPKDKRGRIARLFAAKVALAAKADVFTKHDISAHLKEDINKRYADIMK